MALTRKLLESMGIEADKVSSIIEAHSDTVDALKGQIEQYKSAAEKLPSVEKALEKATKDLDGLKATGGDWQAKYEKEHSDFESFKTEQVAKETKAAKAAAFRKLLNAAGVSEKRIDTVMKCSNVDQYELDGDGIKGSEKIVDAIKTEWSDFIVSKGKEGANTKTPPATDPQKTYSREEISRLSRDEINKNWAAINASLQSRGD